MTPQEIANQTADEIHALIDRESEKMMYPHKSDLSALILSAAAKMVRESGAVKALESCESYPDPSGRMVETHNEMLTDAALSKLRALTEHKGEA